MNKKAKAMVAVLLNVDKKEHGRVVKREPKLLEKLDMDQTIGQVLSDPHWKAKLLELCQKFGYEIQAVSMLKHPKHDCNIVVTLLQKETSNRALRKAGRPVTRGGKPIERAQTGKPTMASKRRK